MFSHTKENILRRFWKNWIFLKLIWIQLSKLFSETLFSVMHFPSSTFTFSIFSCKIVIEFFNFSLQHLKGIKYKMNWIYVIIYVIAQKHYFSQIRSKLYYSLNFCSISYLYQLYTLKLNKEDRKWKFIRFNSYIANALIDVPILAKNLF